MSGVAHGHGSIAEQQSCLPAPNKESGGIYPEVLASIISAVNAAFAHVTSTGLDLEGFQMDQKQLGEVVSSFVLS